MARLSSNLMTLQEQSNINGATTTTTTTTIGTVNSDDIQEWLCRLGVGNSYDSESYRDINKFVPSGSSPLLLPPVGS